MTLALRPGPDPLEAEMWNEAVAVLIAYSRGTGPPPTVPIWIPEGMLVPVSTEFG